VRLARSLIVLSFLTAFSPAAWPAQSLGKLASVKVSGNHDLAANDIAAAAGLEIGQSLSEVELKQAAERLGQTGMFTDLTYQYSTLPGKVFVQLTVVESTKLVDVRFDNFAWWTDDELMARLHSMVPLFKGKVPLSSSMADTVADALQALVTGRNLPGHVEYMQFALTDQPVSALVFRIEATPIKIHDVQFPGALPEDLPDLQAAAKAQLADKDYGRALVNTVAAIDFRDAYIHRGFLQVELGAAIPTPIPDSKDPILIDVRVPVTPGPQFKVSAFTWTGNKAVTAETLQKLLKVEPGQSANSLGLTQDLRAIHKLYSTHGYMRESAELKPTLDAATHTVAYTIAVNEGDRFRFGGLKIDGLDPHASARVGEKWLMRDGDPYDSSYPDKLLPDLTSVLPTGMRWEVTVHEDLNDKEKTVEVTLAFSPSVR
jgi:outer membrane protein assembly factor BamA